MDPSIKTIIPFCSRNGNAPSDCRLTRGSNDRSRSAAQAVPSPPSALLPGVKYRPAALQLFVARGGWGSPELPCVTRMVRVKRPNLRNQPAFRSGDVREDGFIFRRYNLQR